MTGRLLTPVAIDTGRGLAGLSVPVVNTDVDGDGVTDRLSMGETVEIEYGGDGTYDAIFDHDLGAPLDYGPAERRLQDLLLARSISSRVEIIQGEVPVRQMEVSVDPQGVLPSLPKRLTMVAVELRVLPSGAVSFVDPEGNFYIHEFGVLFRFSGEGDLNDPDIVDNVRALDLMSPRGAPIDPYGPDLGDVVFGDAVDPALGKKPEEETADANGKSGWNRFWDWFDVGVQGASGGVSPKTIQGATAKVSVTRQARIRLEKLLMTAGYRENKQRFGESHDIVEIMARERVASDFPP